MIETVGFPALIAAGDAAAKAADVRVVSCQGADAGIVTLYLVGDVAAVQAAVASGTEAAKRVGQFRGAHVIPRPGPRVAQLIHGLVTENRRAERSAARHLPPSPAANPLREGAAGEAKEAPPPAAQPAERGDGEPPGGGSAANPSAHAAAPPAADPTADQGSDQAETEAVLRKMSVAQLRKRARSRKDFPLSSAEISLAKKETLIRLLLSLSGKERSEEES